jgi:hypothetical protein
MLTNYPKSLKWLLLLPSLVAIFANQLGVMARDDQGINPTLLLAQKYSAPRLITIPPGSNSTVVKNSVIRGERDVYQIKVKQGQQLLINITSTEKNAVFDVIDPNGITLQNEATAWQARLTVTGKYKIIVGGTRGNATYRMQVRLKN